MMTELRPNATLVLAKRRILENFINPGFYIAQSIGLLSAYLLVAGFVRAIGSSGFDYELHPAYELIGRSLAGAFGDFFVAKLFSEGPFLLTLYVAFFPVVFYLAVRSVSRFCLERNAGAIELVTFGPADGTSYSLSFFFADLFMTIVYLAVLVSFMFVSARVSNLILGPPLFRSVIVVFFMSLTRWASAAEYSEYSAPTFTTSRSSSVPIGMACNPGYAAE